MALKHFYSFRQITKIKQALVELSNEQNLVSQIEPLHGRKVCLAAINKQSYGKNNYIKTWYDQVGKSNLVATNVIAPSMNYNAHSNRLLGLSMGADSQLVGTSLIDDVNNYTISMVLNYSEATASCLFSGGTYDDRILAHYPWADNRIYFDSSTLSGSDWRTSTELKVPTYKVAVATFVRNATERAIYINGNLIAVDKNTAPSTSSTTEPFYIGKNPFLRGFVGNLFEVAIAEADDARSLMKTQIKAYSLGCQ